MGGVAAVLIAVDVLLRAYLPRPFWYDEIWRGHFVSEPLGSFWSELAKANTPSAAGWVVMERLGGDLLGWHSWVLRLPGFVALPLLGIGITLLVARFAGWLAGAAAALWICLNSTLLDLGTQLKPYTIETLAAVVAVLLWLSSDRGSGAAEAAAGSAAGEPAPANGVPGGLDRRRVARRTAAGVVSLFSVPAVFIIGPLAVADVVLAAFAIFAARRRRRTRNGSPSADLAEAPRTTDRRPAERPAARTPNPTRAHRRDLVMPVVWRALESAPALVLTAANTFVFVGHQSSQRLGHYWDAQFLAGRGIGGGLAFVARELRDIVTGTPPGIDRYDPSLLHAPSDGSWQSLWLLAPAVVICGLAGAVSLARRHDGRQVLLTLLGAQVAMLAASAIRFWPFGPTRTNLFAVPLIVLVVVAGAAALLRRVVEAAGVAIAGLRGPGVEPADEPHSGRLGARRVGAVTLAVVVVLAVAAVGTGAGISSAAKDGRLYQQRDRLRGLDLTEDATIAARRLYRPGDLVVVGGRLMRPGWIYAMEASDDAPRRPSALPPKPAGATGEPPRIPRSDTLFFVDAGRGEVAADVAARTPAPRRLLLFTFDLDAAAGRSDLVDLRRSGWCASANYSFPQSGTLMVLTRRCQAAAH